MRKKAVASFPFVQREACIPAGVPLEAHSTCICQSFSWASRSQQTLQDFGWLQELTPALLGVCEPSMREESHSLMSFGWPMSVILILWQSLMQMKEDMTKLFTWLLQCPFEIWCNRHQWCAHLMLKSLPSSGQVAFEPWWLLYRGIRVPTFGENNNLLKGTVLRSLTILE